MRWVILILLAKRCESPLSLMHGASKLQPGLPAELTRSKYFDTSPEVSLIVLLVLLFLWPAEHWHYVVGMVNQYGFQALLSHL